jgi:hypothetical protein
MRLSLLADLQGNPKGAKIAVVDADELRFERKGALELRAIVHLDEHVHAERMGGVDESRRFPVRDARHDDEDAIRTPGPRLEHLIGIEEEVLAQGRQAGGLPRLAQIVRPALERGLVREDRQAGGTALSVRPRQARHVEVGPDEAFRRARLLDLGDERRTGGAKLVADRLRKAPRRRRRKGATLDLRGRHGCLGGGDFRALVGFDAGKNVAHGLTRSRPR